MKKLWYDIKPSHKYKSNGKPLQTTGIQTLRVRLAQTVLVTGMRRSLHDADLIVILVPVTHCDRVFNLLGKQCYLVGYAMLDGLPM